MLLSLFPPPCGVGWSSSWGTVRTGRGCRTSTRRAYRWSLMTLRRDVSPDQGDTSTESADEHRRANRLGEVPLQYYLNPPKSR
jgi:hypothetical protein